MEPVQVLEHVCAVFGVLKHTYLLIINSSMKLLEGPEMATRGG
jgi:hypothetical protein